MDANDQQPPKADIADVEVDFGLRASSPTLRVVSCGLTWSQDNPIIPPPMRPPLATSSSSLFDSFPAPDASPSGSDTSRAEEAFERRLRGEYEAAQRRVGQVVRCLPSPDR